MPRQMIGRRSLQHALPSCAQTFEIETAQMHDLILNGRFGRDTAIATLLPHRASSRLLGAIRSPGRSLAILDSVDPALVGRFGNKIQTEFLANNARKKAAHRMLLPFSCSHDRGDRSAGWRPQHRKNAGVLGVGPRRGLW